MGGGSKTTTTTTVTQTAEEKEYTRQQIELAKQQLAFLEEQHGWQSEIFRLTQPLLEKYSLLVDQEFNESQDPAAIELRNKQRQLDAANIDASLANVPIQQELLQRQLDEIRRGGRATDEQKALIADITNRAIEAGDYDIDRFLNTGLNKIREEMAPARGMRPDDAPMIDAAQRVLEEATRQKGQLSGNLRGSQAQAELNFPLNAGAVTNGWNQWQQTFNQNSSQFLSQLRNQAQANRSQLMSQLFQSPMSALESGINLVNASRPNPVDFPRNTTQTTKQSGGSVLGGIGGLLSGIGSVGSMFSSKQAKTDIKPLEAPPGHMLSPGALKENFNDLGSQPPAGGPARVLGGGADGGYGNLSNFGRPTQPGPFKPAFPMNDKGAPFAMFSGGGQMPLTNPPAPPTYPTNDKGAPFAMFAPQQDIPIIDPPRTEEDALARIAQIPVSTWQYKPETGLGGPTHVGPMAEDFNTMVMGKAPEPFINTVDAVGSLMASVKALEKRTRGIGMASHPRKQKRMARVGMR